MIDTIYNVCLYLSYIQLVDLGAIHVATINQIPLYVRGRYKSHGQFIFIFCKIM